MKISKVIKNGKEQWQVHFVAAGEQRRRFFKTEEKAKLFAGGLSSEVKRNGDSWMSVAQPDRLDFLCAIEISKSGKFTLLEAAKAFSVGARQRSDAPVVTEAAQKCILRKMAQGLKPRSIRSLEHTLERFSVEFGSHLVPSVSSPSIESWLSSQQWAPATRKSHRVNVQTFFSYCISMEWMEKNPVARVPVPILDDTPPGILTVEECETLMESCRVNDFKLIALFALCLFCGIRSSEVLKLDRAAIDLDRRIVTISARVSKTRQRRIVTIPGNALAWLQVSCEIPFVNWRTRWRSVREKVGLRFDWKKNAMRHSFGSYHYALHRSADLTCSEMGNSPDMLFKHYRELVTREDAQRFFSIVPKQSDQVAR